MGNCPGKQLLYEKNSLDTCLEFINPQEENAPPEVFQQWRSTAIEELSIFLKLRAEELHDNGEVIIVMVSLCLWEHNLILFAKIEKVYLQ